MGIAAIIALIAQLAPTATQLILTLTHPDGTQTVLAKITAAENLNAQNAADLQALLNKTAAK